MKGGEKKQASDGIFISSMPRTGPSLLPFLPFTFPPVISPHSLSILLLLLGAMFLSQSFSYLSILALRHAKISLFFPSSLIRFSFSFLLPLLSVLMV